MLLWRNTLSYFHYHCYFKVKYKKIYIYLEKHARYYAKALPLKEPPEKTFDLQLKLLQLNTIMEKFLSANVIFAKLLKIIRRLKLWRFVAKN